MAGIDVVNKIISPLNDAKKDVTTLINDLTDISQNALYAGGDIGRVISSNLQKTIEELNTIANGQNQSSLAGLINYMKTVPLGQIIPQDLQSEIASTDAGIPKTTEAGVGGTISVQPNLAVGPQSAIAAKESTQNFGLLSQYFKEKVNITGNQDSEMQTLTERNAENGGLDFSHLFDNTEIGHDIAKEDLQFKSPAKVVSFSENDEMFDNNIISGEVTGRYAGMQNMNESSQQEKNESTSSVADWRNVFDSSISSNDFDEMTSQAPVNGDNG